MNPPFNFVSVPGTPYVFLRGDTNMAKHALERGTIMIEDEIAALPEVQALGPNDFVLDVGAFIGDTALIFAKNGARVIGFESQFDAYSAGEVNTKNCPEILMVHGSVGDGIPVKTNHDEIAGNYGTRTVSRAAVGEPSMLLDSIKFSQRVTFVKIDVEGFEPSVIRGAMELFKRDKPTLLIEIYPEMLKRQGWTKEDIYGPLLELGYTIKEAIGNSSEPRWDILCKMQG